MKLIDNIIFSISVVGLVYFFIDRCKYTSISTYHEKLEKLNKLRKTIAAIENEDKKTNENNTSIIYNEESSEQLKLLKTELKEEVDYE
jgi:sortase (surface protein transpeptidase)